MKIKKVIYGIEFETEHGYITMHSIQSERFVLVYDDSVNGCFSLYINFSLEDRDGTFSIRTNSIKQTFFDFFSMFPNVLKDKKFNELSKIFFENYKKETEITAYTAAFGEPLIFDDFDKNLPPIESITA